MLKKYSFLTVFGLVAAGALINPQMIFAADDALDTTDAGAKIEIGTAGTADYFSFQPSPQVNMVGSTNDEAFIVAAAHSGSFDKANGSAYAMSSAASGLYSITLDGVASTTGIPAVAIADIEDVDGQLNGTGYMLEGKTAE
jgi:hypothetical protein